MEVPKLRFPGFKGIWKKVELNEILVVNSGRDYKHLDPGDIPVYGTGGYMLSVNKALSEDNAIGIGRKGSIDKPQRLNGPFWTVDTLFYCTAKSDNDLSFLYTLFHKINWKKYDESTGVPSLSKATIHKVIDYVPCHNEQKEIGEFFDLIDMKIEKQKEKLEIWYEYKKGMMQKLFSRQLRFKDEDGEEFPEWKEVKLGDISVSISYGMNAAAKEFDGENIYLRITDIDDESRKYIEKGKVSPNGLLEEKYKLMKNDILFARTGASTGKSFIFEDEERSFYFAGFLIRVRLEEAIDAKFVYQNTLTSAYKEWVKIMSMRSGQPGINGVEYGEFSFKLPCLKEQKKISGLLSTIDKKIQYETCKVDLYNQQKKAFMQQMFI